MKYLRTAGLASAALAICLVASACGGSDDTSGGDGVIKLGQVLPINSVQAALAKTQAAGAQVAVDEINAAGGIDGKKLKIIVKDSKLEASRVGTVLRELNDDGVKLTFGFETSPECQAGAEAAVRLGQLVVADYCSSPMLTNPKPASDNFYMLSANGDEISDAAGKYLATKKSAVKDWDVFGYDTDLTRGNWANIQKNIKGAGGSIKENQSFWVPIDATNYRSQLAKQVSGEVGTKDSRGLFLSTYGAGTTSYLKQAEPLGVLDDYSVIVTLGAYWSSALSMDGTSPDIYNVHEYIAGCQNNPMDKAFTKAFEDKMKTQPDAGAYQSYVGVKFYAAAIEKAGSADPKAVQKAFAGLTIDTPTGQKLTMDGTTHKANSPLTVAHMVGDKSSKDGIKIISCEPAI